MPSISYPALAAKIYPERAKAIIPIISKKKV